MAALSLTITAREARLAVLESERRGLLGAVAGAGIGLLDRCD